MTWAFGTQAVGAELTEFNRLDATQLGYAGSLTIELSERRRMTVNLWQSEEHSHAVLGLIGPEVGRV